MLSRIVNAYRGWHAHDGKVFKESVLDSQLTQANGFPEWSSRTEILSEFEHLRDELPPEIQQFDFIRAKLDASIVYLRALLGQHFAFEDLIRSTVGVPPRLFSEELVAECRRAVEAGLTDFGVRLTAEDRERFESRLVIKDRLIIRERIEAAVEKYSWMLKGVLGLERHPSVQMRFVEEDAYWANWLSASGPDNVELKINVHPRIRYLAGSPALLAAHEYCGHALQLASWAREIADGNVDPVCGLITTHGPESFLAEGLAHLITRILIDDHAAPEERVARDFVTYRNVVNNNVHVMINMGSPYQHVFDYAQRHLPFDPPVRIESEITQRSRDLGFRIYLYAYGVGEQALLPTLTLQEEARRPILRSLYTSPLTAEQVKRRVPKAVSPLIAEP